MTKEEALRQLAEIKDRPDGDTEEDHISADRVLLERLSALGDNEVVAAYREARELCHFWYA